MSLPETEQWCTEWHPEKELCKGCRHGCVWWEKACVGKSCFECEFQDGWFK
jgi:hypothetical protein